MRAAALARAAMAALLAGCAAGPSSRPPATAEMAVVAEPLRTILAAPGLAPVVSAAAEHRVQIALGLVEDDAAGVPTLRQTGFRLGAEYFYPASAIKLFAAIAALERLAELRGESGHPLGADTALVYHPLFAGDQRADADPTNLDGGTITLRHEIRKLFLVSDNEAFNRLYDFVGQERLAASTARAGLATARIVHRLERALDAEQNRRAPRIELVGDGFRHLLPERRSAPLAAPPALPALPTLPGLALGAAYLRDGARVEGPMDFSGKNRIALADLQRGLCKVVRPDVDCGGGGAFALTDEDRALLLEPMSQFPRQSANPRYDPAEHPDDEVKYLLRGLERVVPRERFRIFNKIGQAYGFSTENAWIVDPASGRSCFLAATLYTNRDGVLNDDSYEYATTAAAFFDALGEALGRWFWAPEAPGRPAVPAAAPAPASDTQPKKK